jgi:ABC-type glycerol-3-phosphate transport system substrate-binding protein
MRLKKNRISIPLLLIIFVTACQPAQTLEDIAQITSTAKIQETPVNHNQIQVPAAIEIGSEKTPIAPGETLILWHPFSGEEAELITNQVEQYNLQKGGDNPIVAISHADKEILFEDFLLAAKTGNEPDIIIAPGNMLRALYLDDLLQPIDEAFLDTGSLQNTTTIFPVFWNLDINESSRFGLPYFQMGHFLFYNNTWANELGYAEKPLMVDDFSDQACTAFNQNRFDDELENNGTGGYFFPTDAFSIVSWMRAFGGGPQFNSRGELVLDTEENLNAVTFLYRLYADDCSWWTSKEPFPYQYLANRNTIFFSGLAEELFPQQMVMNAVNETTTWSLVPYPSNSGKPVVLFDSFSFGLTEIDEASSKSALEFIQWMQTPENHVEMVYLTGAFPLRADEIQLVERDWDQFPIWQNILQYIPFLEPVTLSEHWHIAEKTLDDLAWQIRQYTVKESDLQTYLRDVESIVNTLIAEGRAE